MNPAFEESAMFENMIDIMFKDEYEVYVFDTAPTANARRFWHVLGVFLVGRQDDEEPRGGAVPPPGPLLQ